MHQRVGVNQFDRAGGAQGGFRVTAHGFAGGQHQQGPQALAAVQHGVAHGLTQTGRGRAGARAGDPELQRGFDSAQLAGRPGRQVKAAPGRGGLAQLQGFGGVQEACSWFQGLSSAPSSTLICCSTAASLSRQ